MLEGDQTGGGECGEDTSDLRVSFYSAWGRLRGVQRISTTEVAITVAGEAVEVGSMAGEDGGRPQLLLGGAGLLEMRHAGWAETWPCGTRRAAVLVIMDGSGRR